MEEAAKKCEKYLGILQFAKSARIIDPRQRPKLSKELSSYVTTETTKGLVQRVFSDDVKCLLEKGEWERYWAMPPVEGPLDLAQWWRSVESQLPTLAYVALRTLPIPHTGCDVERSFSYYWLSRNKLQGRLKPEHHIGRLSFVMNGIIPPLTSDPCSSSNK